MADTQIEITLDGPAVADGAIELRRLIQLGEQFQKPWIHGLCIGKSTGVTPQVA
ncbi:MAG: hypothetical protein R2932_14160 [Caldilineaceae bacterium]